jgi:hypothetical protein
MHTSRSYNRTSIRAIDLAEWLVDEISEADRDWHAIELRARELLELAACEARGRVASEAARPPGAAA